MREINSSNISEFLYEVGGNKYISANWFRKKWWNIKIAWRNRNEKKMENLKRKFLLSDIQELRYWNIKFTRLRYMGSDGLLRSAMFKVKWTGGCCYITQYPGGVPLVVGKPKGPMKFREIECVAIRYKKLGLQRLPTWGVPFRSAL